MQELLTCVFLHLSSPAHYTTSPFTISLWGSGIHTERERELEVIHTLMSVPYRQRKISINHILIMPVHTHTHTLPLSLRVPLIQLYMYFYFIISRSIQRVSCQFFGYGNSQAKSVWKTPSVFRVAVGASVGVSSGLLKPRLLDKWPRATGWAGLCVCVCVCVCVWERERKSETDRRSHAPNKHLLQDTSFCCRTSAR